MCVPAFYRCLFFCFAAFALLPQAFAQPRHPVKWAEKPRLHSIPDSLLREPAVFVLDAKDIQMQGGDGGGEFEQYYTTHRIIHLNDEKGTEAFNTFTIPVIPGTRLYELKARTILPGDKVVEVSSDKAKKVRTESGIYEYRIAMEAVERGAEVEVLITELMPGSATGAEIFQHRIPALKSSFRMIVPEHMRYDCKGYNGFPTPKDSLMGDQRSYNAIAYNTPSADDETNSRYKALLRRVDYKLSYVDRSGNNERRMSWGEMARELHRKYATFTQDERRTADGLLQNIGVREEESDSQKVVAIEEYFKTNISIENGLSDERAIDFDQIIRKKMSTEKGYVRLFAACLRSAGIRYEVGKVGNRFSYELDSNLEMWDYLDDYLFYLPTLQRYVAPAAVAYRYPFVPYQFCGIKGVFTKTQKVPDSGTVIKPDFRLIPDMGMAQNGAGVNASVHFEGDGLLPVVSTELSFKGYSAAGLREGFLFGAKDKQAETIRGIIGLSDKAGDVTDDKIEGAALSNYTTGKPLIISAKVHAPTLMERAGPKYLFRAGALIGRQMELYNDSDRRLPVEIDYPNEQVRTLHISIPAGYKVANPAALRSSVVCKLDGGDACAFSSDYKLEGSELTVNIREYYARTSYPLSAYEAYRKVVNAAADFNKVTLVLQKK